MDARADNCRRRGVCDRALATRSRIVTFRPAFARTVLSGVTALLFFVPSSTLPAQSVVQRFPLVVDIDRPAQRLIESIHLDTESERWDAVTQQLKQLRQSDSQNLIEFDRELLMEPGLAADLLQRRLIPDRGEIVAPLAGNDLPVWRRLLVRQMTPQELLQHGDRAWLAGNLAACGECWQLVEDDLQRVSVGAADLSANADLLKSEIGKRLIIWNGIQGQPRTANTYLERLTRDTPQLEGSVAGRSGNLSEILADWLDQVSQDDQSEFVANTSLRPSRSGRFDLVGRQWSIDITHSNTCPVTPLLWNDILLIHDESGVRAIDPNSGEPRWPADEEDAGDLIHIEPLHEDRRVVAMASGPGALIDGLLFVRTGVSQFVTRHITDEFQRSRLLALDLQREGQIVWTLAAEDLREVSNPSDWIFSGPPQIRGKHLIVPMRSAKPDHRLRLLCLDSANGTIQWDTDCGATFGSSEEQLLPYSDTVLIQRDLAYWNINREAIVCAAADSGRIQWIKAVHGSAPTGAARNLFQANSLSGPVYGVDHTVLAATVAGVIAVDAYSGETKWTQFMDIGPHQFVGETDGVLVTCGPGIEGIDVKTGARLWGYDSAGDGELLPEATLLGGSVIFPTGEGLWTIDARTGRILQRDFFEEVTGKSVDSVMVAGSQIFVGDGEHLTSITIGQEVEPDSESER